MGRNLEKEARLLMLFLVIILMNFWMVFGMGKI